MTVGLIPGRSWGVSPGPREPDKPATRSGRRQSCTGAGWAESGPPRHKGIPPNHGDRRRLPDLRLDPARGAARSGDGEVGIETIRGLATVITGPYIDVFPGTGPPRTEFVGVDRPAPTLGRKGLKIALATPQLGSIRPGAPVYYRGIVVGSVTGTDLSSDAATARVHVFIDQPWARLVRAGSRFWSVSGVDVNVSLFRGVEINLESLRSLITGGVAFATPDADSPPVKDGTVFPLHDKPQKEWLEWAPKIPLRPAG
jgi:hypothetical protein